MIRLEVRNTPAALIRRYLTDEMGGRVDGKDGEKVSGDGWAVRLVDGEPALVGRYRVAVLFIDVEGAKEAGIARFLRLKTMRGGG